MSQSSTSNLTLILGIKPETRQGIIDAIERLVGELPEPGIQDVKLTIVPDHAFGELAHDRYVRFGDKSVGIGRGLTVFEEPTQTQSSSCPYSSDRQTYEAKRNCERALKRAASDPDRNRIIKNAAT